jgi:hypothetical protein
MTVWAISASSGGAQNNYPKTLTQPISEERLKQCHHHFMEERDDLYAWGFPVNSKGRTNQRNMEEGDICFFLCDLHGQGSGTYQFAARVRRVIAKNVAEEVSQAFWDSSDFFPYLIDKPVPINVTPENFGLSLNSSLSYMRSSPQGSQRIVDEDKARPAILAYGSLDEWALDFIERQSSISLKSSVAEALGFDHNAGALKQSSRSLLKAPRRSKLGEANPGAASKMNSKRAKMIGDLGEKAVYMYLKQTLPQAQAHTLKWVANLGEKPGYDIEYKDQDGDVVGVEVKSTVAFEFVSFDITANELACAEKLGENYHLYLVANCLKPKSRVFEVVSDPANVLRDRLTPSVFRFI